MLLFCLLQRGIIRLVKLTGQGQIHEWMEERGNRRRREGGDPGLKLWLWWGGCARQQSVGMGPGSGNRGVVE